MGDRRGRPAHTGVLEDDPPPLFPADIRSRRQRFDASQLVEEKAPPPLPTPSIALTGLQEEGPVPRTAQRSLPPLLFLLRAAVAGPKSRQLVLAERRETRWAIERNDLVSAAGVESCVSFLESKAVTAPVYADYVRRVGGS